ncbi:hypothetical protein A3F45_01245 [Candidatus Curtissbacteria bacterium RIFCSPHIGHO2_12_FULL_41_17]|uniref:Endonuclease/exonuclease/phosphatase domain-containing protein n=3 Tax=Microgenomates group TaxID=1794810 RepID=A0A1F7JV79_9BACT|nr:MAG: hypothetical protein A2693_00825 [Candidatus Curtissbacteria bacterium RIFCSPHIGHO2_01_FULL_40_12]OGE04720.1 MAG: hypothetical protein A3F45_01245 [Candidatus Curtissbacteria bacterium RIFCSPHIGHO2_12_FULL_41_17]OGK59492.1 MAG: hypothetical protein A3I56_04105 [Candidatus Roizmanbacteria bacterium RIFCSPLOWO2_02_FULL_43_10]
MTLGILTYNIQRGCNTQQVYNLDETIKTIRDSGADIVGLNELDNKYHKRSRFDDELEIISKALSMNKVAGPCIIPDEKDESIWYGNALLSRFPMVESYVHRMYVGDNPKAEYDGTHLSEPRSILQAKVDLGKTTLWVICTHLSFDLHNERMKQVKKLEEAILELEGPLVLMGDLNCEPKSEELAVLRKLLDDPSLGKGFVTDPTIGKQIDYILTRGVKVEKIKVIESDASDHLPVFARISF